MKFAVVSQSAKQHNIHKTTTLGAAVQWGMKNMPPTSKAGYDWAVRNTDVSRQVFPPVVGLTQPEDLT